MLASSHFRASPRLVAFLRFIVERELVGDSAHIKGYTIAVEALGRPESFDPQTDPIVRVEAGRLRRALARYYAAEGRNDEIAIDLPLGNYVPTFRRRSLPIGLRKLPFSGRRVIFRRVLHRWRMVAYVAAIAAIVIGIGDVALLMWWRSTATDITGTLGSNPQAASRWRRSYVGPVLYVEPIKIVGTPEPGTISVASLRDRLLDTFARFDDVNIVSNLASFTARARNSTPGDTQTADGPNYRLVTLVQFDRDHSASLMFRLRDEADGTILWSRSFDDLQPTNEAMAAIARVLRAVAVSLLQPFGVIHARERIKYADAGPTDHYRCLLDSHDYLRSFNPARHAAIRACLEWAVADDPTFASGFIQLARVYLREHQFGIDVRPDDPPALDRAFEMAHRALALKPDSARAHFVLFDLSLARGDFAAAEAEGERAIALNPNDMPVVFHYGALLVLLGEVEKGEAIVRKIATDSTVPPGRLNFILFVAAYLKGDLKTATYYAKQMTGDPITFGGLARALLAAKTGDWPTVKQEMLSLSARQPGWSRDPRAELKKLFPAPVVLDRIAADFTAAAAAISN